MPAVSPQANAFTTGTFPQPSMLQQDMNSRLYQQPQFQQYSRQGGPLSPELQNTMQQLQIDPSLHQQAQAPFTQSATSLDPQLSHSNGATKEKKSRRWSLAGRFFDKRKSITEPFNIPNSHAQSFAATYNSGNANIVGLHSGGNDGSHPQPTASGESSASGSHSGSRRSSIVDIPKAFLSSLRRGSLTSNSGSTSSNNSSSHSTAAFGGEENEDEEDEEIDAPVVTILFADGLRQATMATLKAPPRDPRTHSQSLELRGILKKRPSPAPSTGSAASGDSGAHANGASRSRHHSLSPHDVHPMAPTDSSVDLSLLPPRNHRASLVTRSPVPHHPSQQQQQMLSPSWSSNVGTQASPIPARLRPQQSFGPSGRNALPTSAGSPRMPTKLGSPISADQRYMSQGAAIPPDFTPGVQANTYQDRGGERSQGAVYDAGIAVAPDNTLMSPRFAQMQQPMMMYISPRAQDLSVQYYGAANQDPFSQQMLQGRFQYHGSSSQQNSMMDDPMVTAQQSSEVLMMESYGGTSSEGGNGMQNVSSLARKSLSFMDAIEIIPAHRKSEYNRRSDKNATFRILTPDMKSEIRDELNTYKMREMAVHVDSMAPEYIMATPVKEELTSMELEKRLSHQESSTSISSDSTHLDVNNTIKGLETGQDGIDLLAERPSQGSNLAAFFNIVCVVAGTGTLGLPYSLAKGGWIGVGILILSMIMSIYTGILIMKCIYYNGHTRLASYQEIGQHAFGRIGLIAVWFFHTSIVLGAPVMYFILSGTEIRGLTVSSVDISQEAWIWICCSVVSVPFVLLKTLKEVSLLSIFGVIATAVLVGVTMVDSGLDYKNQRDTVQYDSAIARNLPITVATISVCFGGNVVYMHVEESMRHPRAWKKVLVRAMLACCLMYVLVAVPGYLTYGRLAQSPILKSLPDGVPRKVATITIVAHVLLAAPVLMTSFALEVERVWNISVEKHGVFKERIIRTAVRLVIMGCVGGIACLVPYFDAFLSLLGALGNCMLIFVLPIAFYWRLIGWRQMRWYELLWCSIILVIGVLSCIIGSIDAIKELHKRFTEGSPE
ncbi:unnamed protein product [Mortierella alpina]